MPVRKNIFNHKLQHRPLTPISEEFMQPHRVDLSEFTEELYERIVINERRPLILSGMLSKDRLDPESWNLQRRLSELDESKAPAEMGLCEVRVQGVSDYDSGAFEVLEQLSRQDPRDFFRNGLKEGTQKRASMSSTYRDNEYGRSVWYCKVKSQRFFFIFFSSFFVLQDWSFGALVDTWNEELLRVLPEPLRPKSEKDILGGAGVHIELLMGYVGADGTRTPLHRDKGASNAFNCVVWTESPKAFKRWWMFHPDDATALDKRIKQVCISFFSLLRRLLLLLYIPRRRRVIRSS
jgi:hypothetical protein